MLYPCVFRCLVKQFELFLSVVVECGRVCSVGYTMHGLPTSVCVVPVTPVRILMLIP